MDAESSLNDSSTKLTSYKLKKGTIRRKFFECGFEAGRNCTITAIKNSLKPDQLIRYSEMIKFLNELTLATDSSLKEFDKIKHKHLALDTLRKRKTTSKPPKVILEEETTTTTLVIDEPRIKLSLSQIPGTEINDTFSDAPADSIAFDDTSSVITDATDATDFTTAIEASDDLAIGDKVYITYPAINTGESIDNMNPTAAKKRGRKRKTFIHRNFHNPDYIALWEEICNGDRVLIDCIGNVYTYDMENPKYLGKYQLDGKIDTTQPYNPPTSNFDHNYTYGRNTTNN
jgi:hypothetical protein